MNYEQISKMTFAELRALEYDLNRVKCERMSSIIHYTDEDRKKEKKYLLASYAEHDQENQEEWEAKLRKREFLKTYQQRVDKFDITAISKLPEIDKNLVLEFVGIEKRRSHHQNHQLVKDKFGNTDNFAVKVMEHSRRKHLAIHKKLCIANFEKMTMIKIKKLFSSNAILRDVKQFFRFNSKNNFILDLNERWIISINYSKELLIYLIASTK